MNITLCTTSVFLASLVLSACATSTTQQTSSADQDLRKMTSKRLKSVLHRNTVQWGDGSAVYYNGSEIRTFGLDGAVILGVINFKNDQHCSSWNEGGERCSTVYEGSDGTLSFFVPGETDSSGGFARVLKGNPKNL